MKTIMICFLILISINISNYIRFKAPISQLLKQNIHFLNPNEYILICYTRKVKDKVSIGSLSVIRLRPTDREHYWFTITAHCKSIYQISNLPTKINLYQVYLFKTLYSTHLMNIVFKILMYIFLLISTRFKTQTL